MILIIPYYRFLTKGRKIQYNSFVIRRWNLTILLIITAGVFGFITGYVWRDRFTNWYAKDRLTQTQPDISGQLFEDNVAELLKPETATEATHQATEQYSFTGRIQNLSENEIIIENPDDTMADADSLNFLLTDETVYSQLQSTINDAGIITTNDTPLSRIDIAVNDIITVYTEEDIRTATERRLTKVERITAAADNNN